MKAGRVVLEKGADDKQSSRGTNSEKQRICKGEGQSFFFFGRMERSKFER